MYTDLEIMDIFKKYDALCEGHFLLSSGRHSAQYMQCALVLKETEYAQKLCEALAEKFRGDKVGMVIGPALGGIIVAHEVAKALKVPALFTERVDGVMTLRRGFSISEGERIVVVEDVVTTGKSVKEVIELVKELKGVVVGVGSLIDRGEGVDFGVPKKNLLSLRIDTYSSDECPLCKKNVSLVKPGSRNFKK